MTYLVIISMLLYLISMLLLGYVAMRKVRSVEDIYVGGMNVGGVLTALSFFTTYFSSVVFVGATALGWKYGLPIVWKDVFVVLVGTLFAFIFLGARLTCLSRVLKFTSVVGFIEKRYKSRIAGVVASIIIFVGLLIYVVSILVGMVRAVEAVIVDIDYTSALLLITIVTAVYTAMGGYIAQVWTQAAQAIFMIGMALTICIASMLKVGGLFTLYQQLKSVDPSLAGWPYKDFLPLFSLYLSLGFLGWGNPALLLKFVSVRDRISLRTAVIISTTLVAVFTLSLNVASAASRLIVSGDVKPDHAFVYLVKYVLPQGFDIVFLIAILSASMSTITALLGVMTQTIRDLIGARLKLAHRYEVLFYRFTTIVLALISMILALKPPEMIVFLFGVTTSILAGVLTGPVVYGLYSRKITASSVVISMVISFALAIGISAYGSFRAPWTYYSFIPTILVSFMLPPIISSFKLKIN